MLPYKAIYIGKVSKYGARIVDKNGRDCLEFDLYLPGQKMKADGWRVNYTVRVSAWGPEGAGIDKRPNKGDIVGVMGIPLNNGKANALMCFTRDLGIGEEEIQSLLRRISEKE